MPLRSRHFEARPYASDIERLEDEFAWVRARARHLAARIEADQVAERSPPAAGPVEAVNTGDDQVDRLAALEQTLREQIDGRLEATTGAGQMLGLEQLAAEYGLDEVEQMALLLCLIPTTGLGLYSTLGDLNSFSFGICSISPEMVAQFADLDLEGRLRLFKRLGPSGTLATAGLVRVGWSAEDDLNDLWTAGVYLTAKAQRVLVGEVAVDDRTLRCPHCARPTRAVAEA